MARRALVGQVDRLGIDENINRNRGNSSKLSANVRYRRARQAGSALYEAWEAVVGLTKRRGSLDGAWIPLQFCLTRGH
jgi:hypothetical protein